METTSLTEQTNYNNIEEENDAVIERLRECFEEQCKNGNAT